MNNAKTTWPSLKYLPRRRDIFKWFDRCIVARAKLNRRDERGCIDESIFLTHVPLVPCRAVSTPGRGGFARPARVISCAAVSRRRRASACSDASASFERRNRQVVVGVPETTTDRRPASSSWHKRTTTDNTFAHRDFHELVLKFFSLLSSSSSSPSSRQITPTRSLVITTIFHREAATFHRSKSRRPDEVFDGSRRDATRDVLIYRDALSREVTLPWGTRFP